MTLLAFDVAFNICIILFAIGWYIRKRYFPRTVVDLIEKKEISVFEYRRNTKLIMWYRKALSPADVASIKQLFPEEGIVQVISGVSEPDAILVKNDALL